MIGMREADASEWESWNEGSSATGAPVGPGGEVAPGRSCFCCEATDRVTGFVRGIVLGDTGEMGGEGARAGEEGVAT